MNAFDFHNCMNDVAADVADAAVAVAVENVTLAVNSRDLKENCIDDFVEFDVDADALLALMETRQKQNRHFEFLAVASSKECQYCEVKVDHKRDHWCFVEDQVD